MHWSAQPPPAPRIGPSADAEAAPARATAIEAASVSAARLMVVVRNMSPPLRVIAGLGGEPPSGGFLTELCRYSYWSASSTFSLDARLAGRIAESIPARIATTTKIASEPNGSENTTP